MELERRIKTSLHQLTDLENLVLYFILKNKEKTSQWTITQVANYNHVSTSMVTKTLNKVGINGFKELKILIEQDKFITNFQQQKETIDLELESSLFLDALFQTAKKITNQQLNLLSKKIMNYQRVILIGEGFMHYLAKDFAFKLKKCQISAKTINDLETVKYINFEKSAVVIVLSVSGTTPTLKKMLKILKQNIQDTYCVGITASNKCNFWEELDLHFAGEYKSFLDTYEKEIPTVSRICLQFILDLIFRHLFLKNYQIFKKYISKSAEIY